MMDNPEDKAGSVFWCRIPCKLTPHEKQSKTRRESRIQDHLNPSIQTNPRLGSQFDAIKTRGEQSQKGSTGVEEVALDILPGRDQDDAHYEAHSGDNRPNPNQ